MKSKLKKLMLTLFACILSITMVAFANERVEVKVIVNTNMWKDKDGAYSENKELIMVLPINTVIYVQDTTESEDYALCKYKDESGNAIFGYVSKDNIKLFYE